MNLKTNESESLLIDNEKIKLFCHDDFGIKIYQAIKILFNNDDEGAFVGLSIITELVQVAKMFEDQPFKVISYIRSYLSNYLSFNSDTSKKMLHVVTQILEIRDEHKTSELKFIIAEFRSSNFENPNESYKADVSPLDTEFEFKGRKTEYFGVEYIDIKTYMKGFGVAFGLKETKEEMVKKFFSEYENEITQYYEKHSTVKKVDNNKTDIKLIEDITPINWLKSRPLLIELIESLIGLELIEGRDTEGIINEHFRVGKVKPPNQPKHIIWSAPIKLLPYLMDQLSEKRFIEVKGFKHKLTAMHFNNESNEKLIPSSLGTMLSAIKKEAKTDDYVVKSIKTVMETLSNKL